MGDRGFIQYRILIAMCCLVGLASGIAHAKEKSPLLVERYFTIDADPKVKALHISVAVKEYIDHPVIIAHTVPIPDEQRGLVLVKLTRHPGNPPTYSARTELSQKRGPLYKEMLSRLRVAPESYVKQGIVSEAEAEKMIAKDEAMDPVRLNVVAFTGEEGPQFVLRAVDASPAISVPGTGMYYADTGRVAGGRKVYTYYHRFLPRALSPPIPLPLQADFPHLVFPEDEERIEVGRAIRGDDVSDHIASINDQLAEPIYTTQGRYHSDGTFRIPESARVYAEGTSSSVTNLTEKQGFRIWAGNLTVEEVKKVRPDLLPHLEPDYIPSPDIESDPVKRAAQLADLGTQRFVVRMRTREYVQRFTFAFQGANRKCSEMLKEATRFTENISVQKYLDPADFFSGR